MSKSMASSLALAEIRAQFPALARRVDGRPAVYFDGPAGSQVPRPVVQAIGDYLLQHNANHGGVFATSIENDALLADAQAAAADLLHAPDPREIVFGANMTTLTFAFSRALSRDWGENDQVIVTDLDHDANITPWATAASDRRSRVERVRVRLDDCTLDLEDLRAKLSRRTRLVAVGCASNAVGTVNPVRQITEMAHAAGAEVFLDAVHFAPHALLDVQAWNCDYLVCSAYKFFGPHCGILWGRRGRLEDLRPFKVRPSSDDCPDRWMTGTPNFECIAGTRAAIDYLAGLGEGPDRRRRLGSAFERIGAHERELSRRLLAGLASLPALRVLGITNPARLAERVPTVSILHRKHEARAVAEYLAQRGIFVWHGNFYALALSELLGLEPQGMVRIGLLHYNTANEIDQLIEALKELK
jgi:cysteine desulfurase family protein (TIGR01976 family)